MDPNVLASMVFVFSISALGIAARMISGRLKARGVANRELDRKLERLETANAEMARRLENLETIVVSQAAHDPRLVASVPHEISAPAVEEQNRQRAEQLARRLGG